MKLKHLALVVFYSFSYLLWSQQTPTVRDSTSTTFSFRDLNPPDPSSVINKYTYDPITDRYYYTSKVGDYDIKYPIILTPKEFQALIQKENLKPIGGVDKPILEDSPKSCKAKIFLTF